MVWADLFCRPQNYVTWQKTHKKYSSEEKKNNKRDTL
jgi:hypothetical protein